MGVLTEAIAETKRLAGLTEVGASCCYQLHLCQIATVLVVVTVALLPDSQQTA